MGAVVTIVRRRIAFIRTTSTIIRGATTVARNSVGGVP